MISFVLTLLDWLAYLGGLYIAFVLLETFVTAFIGRLITKREIRQWRRS